MDAREFKEKWDLTSQELALELGISKISIDHYCSDRPTPLSIRKALANLDALWEMRRMQDELLTPSTWALYEVAMRRRREKESRENQ